MTIGRGRRRHCGWQCVHLESHNNRTGAPRFNYTCAGRRAGEKVFCVWNFGLHFFGHFRLVLFVCPGCLRSFGAFVSRPHFHSPTAEKIRKMLTLTFPRERKPDGRVPACRTKSCWLQEMITRKLWDGGLLYFLVWPHESLYWQTMRPSKAGLESGTRDPR